MFSPSPDICVGFPVFSHSPGHLVTWPRTVVVNGCSILAVGHDVDCEYHMTSGCQRSIQLCVHEHAVHHGGIYSFLLTRSFVY